MSGKEARCWKPARHEWLGREAGPTQTPKARFPGAECGRHPTAQKSAHGPAAGRATPRPYQPAFPLAQAFQAYPDKALGGPQSGLFVARRLSDPGKPASWGPPMPFLEEALTLPWNTQQRAIDPTLIVGPDGKLHCFFVGSQLVIGAQGKKLKANLLGHAVTEDPELKQWTILTRDAPLLGASERTTDGVENVAVFKRRDGRFQAPSSRVPTVRSCRGPQPPPCAVASR